MARRCVVVTGAGSGFGAAIAARFAADGAQVALLDLDRAAAETQAAALGDAAFALECDVGDGPSTQGAMEAALARFDGKLDVVVNNAGVSHRNKPLLEVDEAEFDRLYRVNVKALFHMARASHAALAAHGGGVVINVGSTAAIRPRPGLVWYNGSKGAVHVITKAMAVEWAPDNIRVCAVAPVLGATALTETFLGGPAEGERLARFLDTIPLGRMSQGSDIAGAVAFLASEEAAFLTGCVLEVDGGRCV